MLRSDAEHLLPLFQFLVNKSYNNQKIERVFVGLTDTNWSSTINRVYKRGGNFPFKDYDEGHYTLVAGLDNEVVVSVKSICQSDYPGQNVHELDYLNS